MKKFVGKPGVDFVVGKVGMEFVWIKELKLWVGKYEVSNLQFRVMKPKHSSRKHEGKDLDADEQPVCWTSYYDAVAYCTWLTSSAAELGVLPKDYHFRLPKKKEWTTFATTGKRDRTFPWGDSWPPKAGNFANKEMFPDGWDLDKY